MWGQIQNKEEMETAINHQSKSETLRIIMENGRVIRKRKDVEKRMNKEVDHIMDRRRFLRKMSESNRMLVSAKVKHLGWAAAGMGGFFSPHIAQDLALCSF